MEPILIYWWDNLLMRIIVFLFFIIVSTRAFSQTCPQFIEPGHLEKLTTNAIEKYYPHLKNIKLKFTPFRSKEYFFQTDINRLFLFQKKQKRTYFIEYNVSLMNCAPSDEALTSILLHELEHINDYEQLNNTELLRLFTRLLDPYFRQKFERETDQAVIHFHQTHGLLEFRQWMNERLTQKQIQKKEFYYFSASELESILELQNQN
jgi:hypothetical protein